MEDVRKQRCLWHPSSRGLNDNREKNNAFEVIGFAHIYLHHPPIQDMIENESLLKLMAKPSAGETASLFA